MEVELTNHLAMGLPGTAPRWREYPERVDPEDVGSPSSVGPYQHAQGSGRHLEPQMSASTSAAFEGFDGKIPAIYSRKLSTRDLEAYLQELYGVKVGRDLISKVTYAVMEDARAWQTRPLEDLYPVLFLVVLVLKI